MWISTLDGLSQYNGYKFINYSMANGLSSNFVNDVTEIDGKIYVALFDGSIDVIENGAVSHMPKLLKPINRFGKFYGQTVALTRGAGMYIYQNGKFVKPKQEINSWFMNSLMQVNDSLSLGTNGLAIYMITKNLAPWLDTLLPRDKIVLNLFKDSKKRIWACTNKGVYELIIDFSHKKLQLNPHREFYQGTLNGSFITTISGDPTGIFWIGTKTGLVKIDGPQSFKIFDEKDGLPSACINEIFCDSEKNTWVGTTEGLVKIAGETGLSVIQIPEGRTTLGGRGSVSILPLNNDDLLFVTDGHHVYRSASNSFSNFIPHDTIAYNVIVPGTKPLLFYDGAAVAYFDSARKRFEPLKRNVPRIYNDVSYFAPDNVCVDSNGNVFMGMQEGITAVSSKKLWVNQTIGEQIYSMTIDKKGFLWVATMINPETQKSYLFRVRYSFTKDSLIFQKRDYSQLVKNAYVRKLFADSKGNIFAGTLSKGVFCLTQRNENDYNVKTFDQSSGLTSNYIKSIVETPAGDILLGTNSSIDKLVSEKKGFHVFNFGNVINLHGTIFSIAPAGNNEWWCVVNDKLARFKDIGLEKKTPLPVIIVSARLGAVKDSIELKKTDTVIFLKHNQNLAGFEFSAPGFINEKQILYSYRLSGTNDTTWSVPKNVHEVSYASLQPGNYTFEVRTIGWNNQTGESTKFFFNIEPPYWQTWWFRTTCLLALFALLFALYRYRIRQILKLQKVRNRIATDLHDDIGSTLTNISILTELSKRNKEKPEKTDAYLARISEEINASGQALDDIIWSVNSKNDTIRETAARMRRYAAELFDSQNIRYELTMDPLIADKKILMEQRRDLHLIFKESLNNIYKHASATAVVIRLFIEKTNLIMIITDNGKGFDTTKHTHRNGVVSIKERVKRWRGNIDIESGNGAGTVIKVRLPLSGITQKRD